MVVVCLVEDKVVTPKIYSQRLKEYEVQEKYWIRSFVKLKSECYIYTIRGLAFEVRSL